MEKIYMEDSSRQSSKSSNKLKLSVVLSFVVAFFAIFSLVACGLSQVSKVSYAAPTDGEIVPDEFNFVDGDIYVTITNGTNGFGVPSYFANSTSGKEIYCIEPSAHVENNRPYERGTTAITDPGLLYLLTQFYDDNGNNKDVIDIASRNGQRYIDVTTSADVTNTVNKLYNSLVKQAAIWVYITESTNGTYSSTLNNTENGSILYNWYKGTGSIANILMQDDDSFQQVSFDVDENEVIEKIRYYVNAAKQVDTYSDVKITADSYDDNNQPVVVKNEDGDYVISYHVTSSGSLNGYTVSVTKPDGSSYEAGKIKIYGDGNEPFDGTVVCDGNSCLDHFTVVVSKDVIAEMQTVYSFKVNVDATFDSLTGGIYQAKTNPESLQKVVTVSTSSKSQGTSEEFVISEDTGMTTAQTIYFIGLVVLLCGIGIVYANAKPAESKQ